MSKGRPGGVKGFLITKHTNHAEKGLQDSGETTFWEKVSLPETPLTKTFLRAFIHHRDTEARRGQPRARRSCVFFLLNHQQKSARCSSLRTKVSALVICPFCRNAFCEFHSAVSAGCNTQNLSVLVSSLCLRVSVVVVFSVQSWPRNADRG